MTVVSVAHLGQTIASGKPLAKLGSGRLSFQATTDMNTASLLRVGATGRATSDLSKGSFAIRLSAKRPGIAPGGGPGSKLTLTPMNPAAAARYVGQNMALHIQHRSGRRAAVGGAGVSGDHQRLRRVVGHGACTAHSAGVGARPGRARLRGPEVVRPIGGGLTAGEQVVIGLGGSG